LIIFNTFAQHTYPWNTVKETVKTEHETSKAGTPLFKSTETTSQEAIKETEIKNGFFKDQKTVTTTTTDEKVEAPHFFSWLFNLKTKDKTKTTTTKVETQINSRGHMAKKLYLEQRNLESVT